jgi:hypothetical protein
MTTLRLPFSYLVKDIIKQPACLGCTNYIQYKYSNPYDELLYSGLCKKFGRQNLVTGRIQYDEAHECRNNSQKCGEKGNHFNYNWNKT